MNSNPCPSCGQEMKWTRSGQYMDSGGYSCPNPNCNYTGWHSIKTTPAVREALKNETSHTLTSRGTGHGWMYEIREEFCAVCGISKENFDKFSCGVHREESPPVIHPSCSSKEFFKELTKKEEEVFLSHTIDRECVGGDINGGRYAPFCTFCGVKGMEVIKNTCTAARVGKLRMLESSILQDYFWFVSGPEDRLVKAALRYVDVIKNRLCSLKEQEEKSFSFQVGLLKVTGKPACEGSMAKCFLNFNFVPKARFLRGCLKK